MKLKNQRGISLVIVIFLLAGISVMVVSMMNLSSTQHMTTLHSVRGTQAYFAARSGMEYAVARLTAGATCAGIASPLTISGFTVTLACAAAGTFNEGNAAASYIIYSLTATASNGNFQVSNVANRQITATVKVP
ncbi:MAG TPA: hypothetical protein VGL10_04900 [Gammaproteobacteria bacterium]